MASHNQVIEAKSKKKNRSKVEVSIVTNQVPNSVALNILPPSLLNATNHCFIDIQAASRFQTAQRRVMAAQIGQGQGNRHLQRMMTSIETKKITPYASNKGSAVLEVVQLSPLSEELQRIWITENKGVFFERLRDLNESDPDVHDFVKRTLTGEDLWLAQNLLTYGREANWPEHVRRRQSERTTLSTLLTRLSNLGEAAKRGGVADFQTAINRFRQHLRLRIDAVSVNTPLPSDITLIMKALLLWSADRGTQWGEGIWDSSDLQMSAPDYATVPASQYKCNAYVAEVIFQSLGLIFKVHESDQQRGKYFPYQANEWGNSGLNIPHFPVVSSRMMGDIWSNGRHMGIYLGEYAGKKLYISARDDGSGVFGLREQLQREHGIQIKNMPDGGVFRRYTPSAGGRTQVVPQQ